MSKASIIIPIYNVCNHVKKTIESALGQSEPDIEVILVDDGSTDGCSEICNHYAKIDERVIVVHKKNGGLSSARNAGTEIATSEYVMYLDGDDYLRIDAVECCLEVMKRFPADFVQFLYREVSAYEEPVVATPTDKIYQAHTSKELFENLYRLGGVAASGATKFMRRELAIKIPFENIRHEDEMWCTRAFSNNLTVTYLSEELYYYVMRDGSIIHSGFNRSKLDSFIVSEERIKALQVMKFDGLASCEYRKLFLRILSIYNEARNANDQTSVSEIRNLFEKQKNEIKQYAKLRGKLRWIFELMCWDFAAIDIYRIYWKMKGI